MASAVTTKAGEQLVLGAAIGAEPAGAAVDGVGFGRADVAGGCRRVPRRLEQVAGEALAPLHLQVGPHERRDQDGPDQGRDGDACQHRRRAPTAGRDDQRHEAHRRADRADDAVVDRRRRLEGARRAERQRATPRGPRDEPVQRQGDQRHRVGRLQLQVAEVREVVRPEAPDRAADQRGPRRAGHRAHERVHRQRRGQQRQHQDHVVGEHGVAGQGVERPREHGDDEEVIRVGQGLSRRMEDRRVEHAAGHDLRRRAGHRLEVPAEDPEVQVRIARPVQGGDAGRTGRAPAAR